MQVPIKSVHSRREFNRASVVSLLTAAIATSLDGEVSAQAQAATTASARRDVIKQELPGEPTRELTLIEVTYPPGTGSPAHLHANGVMAFVVSGAVTSKVGDGPEQTFKTGGAWWEPPGAVHRALAPRRPVCPSVCTLRSLVIRRNACASNSYRRSRARVNARHAAFVECNRETAREERI